MVNYYSSMTNIIDVLRIHAETQPNQKAITFIDEQNNLNTTDYQNLYQIVQNIANNLIIKHKKQDRVILALKPSENYAFAFLGCLAANIIPVPCYPPSTHELLERLIQIAKDCDAQAIVFDSDVYEFLNKPELNATSNKSKSDDSFKNPGIKINESIISYPKIDISTIIKGGATHTPAVENEIAFLQYTSGTTGSVKGVIVTHSCIIENLKLIQKQFASDQNDVGYIWLPPFHDMGLIGGLLETLFVGFHTYFTSPLTFTRNPLTWLKGISTYRATISGGPTFAFELASKIPDGRIPEGMDLSSWRVAFCGAEPIHNQALCDFSKKFKPYKFMESSYHTCYGLAEATLYVCGKQGDYRSSLLYVDEKSLQNDKIITVTEPIKQACTLVSSGLVNDTVLIVSPERHEVLEDGYVGKIIVTGKSITQGYWGNGEHNKNLFLRMDKNGDVLNYIDTGDRGAIYNNNLYILGRFKDLIIINGKNYFVSHIELSLVEQVDSLRKGSTVIIQDPQTGKIYVLAETRPIFSEEEAKKIKEEIHDHLKNNYDLPIDEIHLLKKNSIPKTTSGKISRVNCLIKLKNAQFIVYYDDANNLPNDLKKTSADLLDHIKNTVRESAHTLMHTSDLLDETNFLERAASSLKLLELCHLINKKLEVDLVVPSDVYYYPTINSLSEYIVTLLSKSNQESSLDHEEHNKNDSVINPIEISANVSDSGHQTYQATSLQKNMFYQNELNPAANLVSRAIKITGPIEKERLLQLTIKYLNSYQVFRTFYVAKNDIIYCRNQTGLLSNLVEIDARSCTKDQVTVELERLCQKGFNLSEAPLWRVCFLQLSDNECLLMLVIHHSIADAYSLKKIINRLFLSYFYGQESACIERYSFQDYAHYEHKLLSSTRYAQCLEFWRRYNELFLINFPYKKQITNELSISRGVPIFYSIDNKSYHSIVADVKQNKTTYSNYFLAKLIYYLSFSLKNSSLTITNTFYNRSHFLNDVIGPLYNCLPLSFYGLEHIRFNRLLEWVTYKGFDVMRYESFPIDERLINRQILFNYIEDDGSSLQAINLATLNKGDSIIHPVKDIELSSYPLTATTINYHLCFYIIHTNQSFIFKILFQDHLFIRMKINKLWRDFFKFIEQINPSNKTQSK